MCCLSLFDSNAHKTFHSRRCCRQWEDSFFFSNWIDWFYDSFMFVKWNLWLLMLCTTKHIFGQSQLLDFVSFQSICFCLMKCDKKKLKRKQKWLFYLRCVPTQPLAIIKSRKFCWHDIVVFFFSFSFSLMFFEIH